MRTRGQEPQAWLVPLGALYLLAFAPVMVVAAAPAFEHGTPGSSGGLHDRISHYAFYLAWALTAVSALGAIRSVRRKRISRPWATSLVAYGAVLILSQFFNGGGFDPRLVVLPGLLLAASRLHGMPIQQLTRHLRYGFRAVTVGSLMLLASDPTNSFFTANDRTLFGLAQLAGVTPHPNVLGPAAAMALACELAPATRRRSLLGISSAVAAGLLTQSRAGLALMLVVVLFSSVRAQRNAVKYGVALSWLGGVALLGSMITSDSAWFAITGLFDPSQLHGRENVWAVALDLFQRNPILGGGPDAFAPVTQGQYGSALATVAGQAHNQLLETLAATGLVGGVALVAFLVAGWSQGRRLRAQGAWLPLALLTVLCLDFLVEAPLRTALTTQSFMVIAVVALLSAAPDQSGDQATAEEPGADHSWIFAEPRKG